MFHDTKVPAENIVGAEGDGGKIFYRMMIPERLTSAAGSLGGARAAIEVAARYTTKRKAFGQQIKNFQAVSFKIAEAPDRARRGPRPRVRDGQPRSTAVRSRPAGCAGWCRSPRSSRQRWRGTS